MLKRENLEGCYYLVQQLTPRGTSGEGIHTTLYVIINCLKFADSICIHEADPEACMNRICCRVQTISAWRLWILYIYVWNT